ncbi:hypothetical protein PT015_08125 [Candidatus Mycobacterium wuenschmannii]|uniref:PE-PGRS family protein n=1 Tax=Candidatus Mycobacterium wuenschmannii TaxID=3027808 RepID=A0ABY8W2G2_9MYCO|nr:hypothetical protein [Candidatus Mycobacterium wuenschmannii]WIM89395.1 hypothetical protein PT015_08125 [Candidatus Mycobacterium wuenschmannii]
MPLALPSDSKLARASRLAIAGAAVVGAGLFALNAPTVAGPLIQHRDVQLVSGEVDWTTFLSNTEDSLASLQENGAASSAALSEALGNVSEHFGTQISNAITGFDTGINNALFGGWYGGDDGYVFGLFGGQPVIGPDGATMTGSLLSVLSNDLQNGQAQLFYSDFNNYTLEVLDHTMKPLLAPLLDETSKGVTTLSIPVELSQIQTSLLETFGSYNELKAVAETVLSPEISGFFALSGDLDAISAAMTAGDSATAMTDLNNIGSDVLNAIINGWVPPAGAEGDLFPGLIGAGSFLDELYTTWTTQFIDALGSLATESAATGASEAVGTSLPDLFSGLLGF